MWTGNVTQIDEHQPSISTSVWNVCRLFVVFYTTTKWFSGNQMSFCSSSEFRSESLRHFLGIFTMKNTAFSSFSNRTRRKTKKTANSCWRLPALAVTCTVTYRFVGHVNFGWLLERCFVRKLMLEKGKWIFRLILLAFSACFCRFSEIVGFETASVWWKHMWLCVTVLSIAPLKNNKRRFEQCIVSAHVHRPTPTAVDHWQPANHVLFRFFPFQYDRMAPKNGRLSIK